MELIKALGFIPKESHVNIYQKQYSNHDNYFIEIDLERNSIDYGNKKKSKS